MILHTSLLHDNGVSATYSRRINSVQQYTPDDNGVGQKARFSRP